MLYEACKGLVLAVMKTPGEPPEAPAGSHASVQVFRASPRYLSYRLLGFWIGMGCLGLAWTALVISAFVDKEIVPLVLAGDEACADDCR